MTVKVEVETGPSPALFLPHTWKVTLPGGSGTNHLIPGGVNGLEVLAAPVSGGEPTTTLFWVTKNSNCPAAAGEPAPGSRKNKKGLFEIPCAPFCGWRSTGAKGKIIRPAKSIKSRTEIGGGGGVSPTFCAIPITVFDPRSRAYWMRLMSVIPASQAIGYVRICI